MVTLRLWWCNRALVSSEPREQGNVHTGKVPIPWKCGDSPGRAGGGHHGQNSAGLCSGIRVSSSETLCKVRIRFLSGFLSSHNDMPLWFYMRPPCFRDSGKYSGFETYEQVGSQMVRLTVFSFPQLLPRKPFQRNFLVSLSAVSFLGSSSKVKWARQVFM